MGGLGRDALHTVLLILRREFLTRVRGRFFLIGTAVLVVLVAGFIVLQAVVLNQATTTVRVGFVGATQALAEPLRAAVTGGGITVQTKDVQSVSSGEDQVRSGNLELLISGDPAAPEVEFKDQLQPTVATALDELIKQVAFEQALAGSGVDPATIEAKVAAARFHPVALDPNAAQRTQRIVVGIFVAALLFTALQLYGGFVATGIVEEKQNRIVEILLSTVRPRQLLVGKVVGIGLLGFIQLIILGAVALVAASRTQVISVPDIGAAAVAGGIVWYLLGFAFYALVYAAGGSLVSRQEDLQAVLTPITIVVVGTYLAFFWVVSNPDNPIAIGLSMLPAMSPILMPARMASGEAQAWQVVVAVVLSIAATFGMTRLAATIYTNSVLKVGSRVGWLEALGAAQETRWRGSAARASRAPKP